MNLVQTEEKLQLLQLEIEDLEDAKVKIATSLIKVICCILNDW